MNSPHQVKIIIRKKQWHQFAFFHAHAMLAGQRAANFHAIANDLGRSLNGSLILPRIPRIKQNNGMQISVPGMKNIPNFEIISFTDFPNAPSRPEEFLTLV